MLQIQSPFQQLFDTNGSPLDDGYVYIGTANTNPETSPIAIYWDDAGTIPAAQPLRTMNGYLVRSGTPARVYTAADDFSMTVKDKQGRVVFSVLDATSDSNLTTALASSSGSSLVGFLQAGANAQPRTVQSKLRDVVSVKDFGAVGDNSTDDTAAFQAAINYANSVWVGGSQLGGGVTVYIPAGRYKLGALIYKNGVNLQGEGKLNTQLRVFGNNTTLIAASSNTSTQTSSSNLFYGSWKDFSILSWEGANGSTPTGQVGWDAIGFSRWYCENIYFGWGTGFVAIRMTNAILAGSGGPSNWYNTFVGCICEKHYVGTGGVGLLLGDTSSTKEQITTWNWIGGSIRGSGDGTGTGLNLQSGTGCTFYGVCFEAVQNAVLLGSPAGTRFANSIDFIGCYWEGNSVNWNVYAGCTNNGFIGGFVTGGTGTDNGSYTRFSIPGATKSHIQGASAADYWRVQMINGGVNRPQFTGSSFPSIGLENSSGTEVVLGNGAATSSATDYFGVYADDLSLLIKAGLSSATVRAPTINLANSSVGITVSSGSPEGTFAAPVGSLYMRTDGGAGTTLYVKQSGTGNTGWVGK